MSTIQIEPYHTPTRSPAPDVNPRLVRALAEITQAPDLAALERAIVPLRAWPEGPDKAACRAALRARETELKARAPFSLAALQALWRGLWRGTCNAIGADSARMGRPMLRGPGGSLGPVQTPPINQAPGMTQALAELGEVLTRPAPEAAPEAIETRDTAPTPAPGPIDTSGQTQTMTQVIESTLAGIAQEGHANAAGGDGGSLGQGRRGVGFDSSEGYVRALANGVKAATAQEYKQTLISRYGYTLSEVAALRVTILPETPLPSGPGRVTDNTVDGKSIFDRPRSERRPIVTTQPTAQETRVAVAREDVVIGAREGGSGILTGWAGSGELTRTQIRAILSAAGLPEYLAPAPKSDHFHASAALTALTQAGRVIRSERGKVRHTHVDGTGLYRQYVARWTVGNPQHGQVGDKFGLTVLTAGLTASGLLDLVGEPELCNRVRDEYTRRQGDGGVYPAGEVTDWLRAILVNRYGAVRLGANWYVPGANATEAERLCSEVSRAWGLSWILPALPVATSDQLRAGLVRGLAQEADQVLMDLEDQKTANKGTIGPKAAASLLGKLRDVYIRAKSYATLLEPRFTADIRSKLEAALATIEPLCDDTAQRFAMLDLT